MNIVYELLIEKLKSLSFLFIIIFIKIMYIFGCEDTTTIIMDYLKRKETRSLLCVNKNFNNI